jgi:hypothetical protein
MVRKDFSSSDCEKAMLEIESIEHINDIIMRNLLLGIVDLLGG